MIFLRAASEESNAKERKRLGDASPKRSRRSLDPRRKGGFVMYSFIFRFDRSEMRTLRGITNKREWRWATSWATNIG